MRKHLFAEGFAGFLVTVSVTFPILSMVNLPQVPKRFKRVMFNKFHAGILVDMTEWRIHLLPFLLLTIARSRKSWVNDTARAAT